MVTTRFISGLREFTPEYKCSMVDNFLIVRALPFRAIGLCLTSIANIHQAYYDAKCHTR